MRLPYCVKNLKPHSYSASKLGLMANKLAVKQNNGQLKKFKFSTDCVIKIVFMQKCYLVYPKYNISLKNGPAKT